MTHVVIQGVLGFLILVIATNHNVRLRAAVATAQKNRDRLTDVEKLLIAIDTRLSLVQASTLRIETGNRVVAVDLADSHLRADEAEGGVAGAQADAASRSH